MALVVISIDRTRLPPHTDEDFQEWVEAYIGQSGCISLVNPLAGMRVADEFRDIEIAYDFDTAE